MTRSVTFSTIRMLFVRGEKVRMCGVTMCTPAPDILIMRGHKNSREFYMGRLA